MDWLQQIDAELFRFMHLKLRNGFFDAVMPFLSGNKFFFPAILVLGSILIWKGRLRGLICVLMLALVVSLGDGFVCRPMKKALDRPRPFAAMPEISPLSGKGGSGSMPSSHAANWFAATLIAFIYYRRSIRIMLPLATLVGFSRVYVGVHYPGRS